MYSLDHCFIDCKLQSIGYSLALLMYYAIARSVVGSSFFFVRATLRGRSSRCAFLVPCALSTGAVKSKTAK
jgi:hypothetical protein